MIQLHLYLGPFVPLDVVVEAFDRGGATDADAKVALATAIRHRSMIVWVIGFKIFISLLLIPCTHFQPVDANKAKELSVVKHVALRDKTCHSVLKARAAHLLEVRVNDLLIFDSIG